MSEDRCDSCGRTIGTDQRTYPSDRGDVCRDCCEEWLKDGLRKLGEAIRRMRDRRGS